MHKQRKVRFGLCRACDVCIYSRTNEGVEREMLKNNILEELKGIAIIYAQNKLKVE